MTYEQLTHAIRSACDVANESEVVVFGSQAILAKFPDASEHLCQSMEIDIAPGSNDPKAADTIDGILGENSGFHCTHGFYVHGLTIEAAVLPNGWERRTIAIDGLADHPTTGRCIEAHDLAASKLAAFREKDRDFVRTLLAERLINARKLSLRISQLPASCAIPQETLERWLDATVTELFFFGRGPGTRAAAVTQWPTAS